MEDQGDIAAFRWNAFQLQGSRRRQEDDFIVRRLNQANWVVAVADGLGGHEHGDRASDVAVDRISWQVECECHRHPKMRLMTPEAWHRAFLSCDEAVRQIPCSFSRHRPASTLIAAHLDEYGNVSIAAMGDSSIWHRGQAGIRSLVGRQGAGHWVAQAIGYGPMGADAIEMASITMAPGDRLILATDGIETLTPDLLGATFCEPLDVAVERLIAAVRIAAIPNQDNVTVLMVDFVGSESP